MRPAVTTAREQSDDDVRTAAEVMAMADARRFDPAVVDRALSSATPYVRRMATIAVGQAGGAQSAGRLRLLLTDSDSGVSANAAFALGLLRDTASVGVLARSFSAGGPAALEAAWALGEIGEPARAAILELLGGTAYASGASTGPSPSARAELIIAASRLRPLPADVIAVFARPPAPAAASAGDTSAVVLARAASYAFGRPRSPAGVGALLSLAGVSDEETRANVARGLARSAAGDSLGGRALAPLRNLVRDPSPHVRINALRSLATYGEPARDAMLAAVADRDPNVRITVAQSLTNALASSRDDWTRFWNADSGFTFRGSLLASAVRAGVVLDALGSDDPTRWAANADWRYRAAAASAAGNATSAQVARAIAFPLLRDPDGRVRAAALGAIADWADSAGPDRDAIRRELQSNGLTDTDEQVRATAIAALTRSARAADVAPVLASYQLARADTGSDARLAAIRFFESAWRNDSAAFGPLRETLSALPVPEDPLERAAGRGSPLFAHWAAPSGTTRPLSWYEGVVRSAIVPSLGGTPPTADIVTERGTITIELFGADAPLTVTNFTSLARSGWYRNTRFHRVVPNFVAQDGDPRGDGSGGPGYAIRDELNRRRYVRGAVGMALSGPDTGGSQYFLTHSPQPHLDGHYTVFGRVVQGFDVLDQLVQGDRILEVRAR